MKPLKGDWIQTASGIAFYPLDPDPDDIIIDDIAHALSRQCRYGGHVKVDHYSVAEHCVLLSHAVPPEYALSALLHDAAEAYLPDIVRPVKKQLSGYLAHEERLERAIFSKFDVPFPVPQLVQTYDIRICSDECDQILADPPMPWASDMPLGVEIQCWPAPIAKAMFLMRFNELYHD